MKIDKARVIVYSILALAIITILYINNNRGSFYANLAQNSYRKNNIPKTQEYLEKAFMYGETNYKLRNIYVNSIINYPFDINAQERLLRFLSFSEESDSAQIKAMDFLHDFQREIHKKYPGNYITQTVYNQKVMRWNNVPITYAFINPEQAPKYFIEEIEAAFENWEYSTGRQILFTQTSFEPNIKITFNSNNPADVNSRKYIVAYTTPELNLATLSSMTINFYLKDPFGDLYSRNHVYNTALHEIAHAIGFMGHSDNIEDIMHSTKDAKSILNDSREELSFADINTIKLLYKIKPDITNENTPTGSYTPGLVLGSESQIQKAKMNEAVAYIKNAPKVAIGYMDLAESFVAKKDYTNAIKSLKKALKLSNTAETRGMIYYNLAVVSFMSEDYKNAHKYLSASMQYNENNDTKYLMAEIYTRIGEVEKAIKLYENLILDNPQNIDYTIGLVNIYLREQKYMKARKVLKNYIKTNPKDRNNEKLQSYGIIKIFL